MYEEADENDQEFTLGCMRTQMTNIKTEVNALELEIIHQATADSKQMDELVSIDGLEEKIKEKMTKYLMSKTGVEMKQQQVQ